ncbi:hypothetical protein [Microvirga arabica]|uniref:hypothetical protein n=1 Tax=Microvirga arabica TaxID=1128671 RepID=UPI00193A5565|nr:hypothetical protein [Microvirga arabica]MBM1172050.1 hypothetical protein [Microvirga arabica]
MTVPYDTFLSLVSALNSQFRGHDTRDWQEWQAFATTSAAEVPVDADRAWLSRVKASHRGIAKNKRLKHLIAGAVDQDYLDEICTLGGLERLELEYPVTAINLAGLRALRNLRHLSIDSPRNITDFAPLLDLPSLRTLLMTNAKHMADITWLSGAHHLEVIGIEGSTWTDQKIPSLAPLAGLKGLRAFLAVSTRLDDKDLSPLAECPNLEFLHCAMIAPREEFERLHRRMPNVVCSWFRPERWGMLGR